jgi:hypothetical protein
MISYTYSQINVPDSRWFVIQRRERRSRRCVLISLVALVVSEMFVWDTTSCKEHIYDKLIQQLYVAGRSDFLHLNPTVKIVYLFFTLVNYVSIGTVR